MCWLYSKSSNISLFCVAFHLFERDQSLEQIYPKPVWPFCGWQPTWYGSMNFQFSTEIDFKTTGRESYCHWFVNLEWISFSFIDVCVCLFVHVKKRARERIMFFFCKISQILHNKKVFFKEVDHKGKSELSQRPPAFFR